jgi:DNA-binding CsgD family transcriptional regulator
MRDRDEHPFDGIDLAPLDLLGRERELSMLHGLIRDGRRAGAALIVRGEAGAGKSALLTAADWYARTRGTRVLRVTGVEAETDLPYAGLYSLLRPVLQGLDGLATPQRDALSAAFGMGEPVCAEPFMLGLATLELLTGVAATTPLLVVVEDAHRLDQPTLEVLAFVARRLPAERIVLLAAISNEHEGDIDLSDLPALRLDGIDTAAAASLLGERAPALSSTLRSRVIELAAGNPLALCELSASLLAAEAADAPTPTALELPLGDRLTRAFSIRLEGLPAPTQRLLLLAACDDHALIAETLAAAESIGERVTAMVQAIEPAVAAGIATVEGPRLRFTHPLMRSAVYQRADLAARLAAHAAVAEAVRRDAFRHAWHRALSIIGPDAELAAELHAAATTARARGRMGDAFVAFERAAWLTDDPAAHTRSLLAAAGAALELGWPDLGRRLVAAAEAPELHGKERDLAACALRLLGDGTGEEAEIDDLLRYAELAPDMPGARRAVFRAAVNALWLEPDAQVSASIVATTDALDLAEDDPWRLAIMASVGPVEQRDEIFERLEQAAAGATESCDVAFVLGYAASVTCQDERASSLLSQAIDGLRAQRRLRMLTQALTLRSWAQIGLARLDAATSDAAEATELASITGQSLWEARALAASALLAAMRGEDDAVGRLADAADRQGVPGVGAAAIADVLIARGHAALAYGRHAEAARTLGRIYDDRDQLGTAFQRLVAIGDFAEAAARSGGAEAARDALADLSRALPAALREGRPEIAYAETLLTDDWCAEDGFRAVLDRAAQLSPFMRARVRLSFGTFLRRQRRVVDSREPLESAAAGFEALGATPWAQRARQELRATGVNCKRGSTSRLELTPQETLIAQMAASGLSNQQIGQRLYLSPRTIGAHLYRVFPKLGVASRGELHHALARENVPVSV